MTSEEGLNAYGALTWGQFFVYQGFNEKAGWMHTTSSGVDNIDDVGDLVYMTADDTLTLTATTNTKAIGFVCKYYGSSTLCDVQTFTPGESRAL